MQTEATGHGQAPAQPPLTNKLDPDVRLAVTCTLELLDLEFNRLWAQPRRDVTNQQLRRHLERAANALECFLEHTK